MSESQERNPVSDAEDVTAADWRFRTGIALIAASFISPLGALLLPFTELSTAMKATLGGLLLAGVPEVLTVVAVAVMGKSGFLIVKRKIMAALRQYGPPKEVGSVRYNIGLVMLLIPVFYSWIVIYAPPDAIPGFPDHRVAMGLTFDFIFIASLFVLGGDFWDKLRALFVHRAKARFPAREPA